MCGWLGDLFVLQTSVVVVAAFRLTAADSDASVRCSLSGIQEPRWGGNDGALDFFAQEVFSGLDEGFDEHGRTL